MRKVAEIPEAGLLNGMGLLSRGEGTILMADSVLRGGMEAQRLHRGI